VLTWQSKGMPSRSVRELAPPPLLYFRNHFPLFISDSSAFCTVHAVDVLVGTYHFYFMELLTFAISSNTRNDIFFIPGMVLYLNLNSCRVDSNVQSDLLGTAIPFTYHVHYKEFKIPFH